VPATVARAPVSPDVVRAMSVVPLLDYLGVRLNGEKDGRPGIVTNWVFSDSTGAMRSTRELGSHIGGPADDVADATVSSSGRR